MCRDGGVFRGHEYGAHDGRFHNGSPRRRRLSRRRCHRHHHRLCRSSLSDQAPARPVQAHGLRGGRLRVKVQAVCCFNTNTQCSAI